MKPANLLTSDLHVTGKLGGIADRHLQEHDRLPLRNVAGLPLRPLLHDVFAGGSLVRMVRDNAYRAATTGVVNPPLRRVIEVHGGRAQLNGAKGSGDQRDDDDGANEEGGDLDPVWSLENVRHRR